MRDEKYKIDELIECLEIQLIWVRGALDCKSWTWDEQQREAAESEYNRATQLLKTLK